eukprot:c47684_g1_i1.p1 GENE.c47684_g1_i1~~c47684_g1_i1.p1  ORF type:complete len:128 (+),score=30.97 c47684_g1_i1:32-415(+)
MSAECKVCVGATPADILAPNQVDEILQGMPLWRKSEDGVMISRSFVAQNFVFAMEFVNKVAAVAEEQSHHPNIHITSYRTVTLDIYTHKVGGITASDIQLARALDQIEVRYSQAWLRDHPEANPNQQ